MFSVLLILLSFSLSTAENEVFHYMRNKLFRQYFDRKENLVANWEARNEKLEGLHPFNYNRYGIDKRTFKNLSNKEFEIVYNNFIPVLITDLLPTLPLYKDQVLQREKLVRKYGKAKAAVTISKKGNEIEGRTMTVDEYKELLDNLSPPAWSYLSDELFLTDHIELKSRIPKVYVCFQHNKISLFA